MEDVSLVLLYLCRRKLSIDFPPEITFMLPQNDLGKAVAFFEDRRESVPVIIPATTKAMMCDPSRVAQDGSRESGHFVSPVCDERVLDFAVLGWELFRSSYDTSRHSRT